MRLRFEPGKIKPTPHEQSSGPATRSTVSSPRNSVVRYLWRLANHLSDRFVGRLYLPLDKVLPIPSADEPAAVFRHQPAARRFERALARVQPLVTRYGYGAVALAVFAEGIGIPLPGQTLLIATSLEAAVGRLNIGLTLVIVTLAAALGNSAGYLLGRWGGRTVFNKLKVNTERQQRIDKFFQRRGGLVILIARFVDGLRQLNGIVAGVLRMPWWTFTAYNLAGAILWTFAWGMGAYYLERDIHLIAGSVQRHRIVLFVLAGVAVIALLIYLLRPGKESRGLG